MIFLKDIKEVKKIWKIIKRLLFIHYGCKVNQYETNAMIQKFIEHNYEIVDFEEKADIYVINTCTVTNMSDRKSRQMLRRVKKINPDSILVVVGCYVQVGKEELEKIDDIDIILGNNEKNEIVEYVENYKEKKENITDVMHQKEFVDFGSVTYTNKTRATIKIQDGCDRFCTYCIVPYARGRVRSRQLNSIIEEVQKIAKRGIKEVIVTGIHIASYGKDFNYKITLIDVLEAINKIDGIERIRIGSLEPTIMNEEFLERLSKLEKVCNHFHLSLQSGCTSVLKRMNRKYTADEFKESVKLLRTYYPDAMLTADVIVGFPGETDEEFNETYKFLEEIKFYRMHIFKYSQRNGTKAAVMPNQVDGNIKEERSNKLIKLSDQIQNNYNQKYIGKEVEVLFEEKENEYIKGHTKNFIVVKVKEEKDLENKIKKVKIIGIENQELVGKIDM